MNKTFEECTILQNVLTSISRSQLFSYKKVHYYVFSKSSFTALVRGSYSQEYSSYCSCISQREVFFEEKPEYYSAKMY